MTRKTKILTVAAAIAALVLIGTATRISRQFRSDANTGDPSLSPLGGLFQRASAVSALKQRMGELREVFPALRQFAQAHQDDLPRTVAELRPLLPAKLAYLDDGQWELPSTGKMSAVVNGTESKATVLLQEKAATPDQARIVVYADGHIEYRK